MSTIGNSTIHGRGTIFNYAFVVVALVTQPVLLTNLEEVVYNHHANWLVGIICLAAVVADLYANIKLPKSPFTGVGLLVWIAHLVLTTLTLYIALGAFDPAIIKYTGTSQPNNLRVVIFLLVFIGNIIKEVIILTKVFDDSDQPKSVQENPTRPIQSNTVWPGEVALLFAASIQSVTFLGLMSTHTNFEHGPVVVLDLIAGAVVFCVAFLPLRLPYTLKEIADFEQTWNLNYIVSVLVAFLSTVYSSMQQ